jgi:hypothetical protein
MCFIKRQEKRVYKKQPSAHSEQVLNCRKIEKKFNLHQPSYWAACTAPNSSGRSRIGRALGAAQAEHSESLDPVPWQLVGSHH